MSLVRILILGVAFAAAMIAALMVRNISAQPEPQTVIMEAPVEEEVVYTKVLIAGRDLTLGERLVPEDLEWQEWPEEALNAAFFDDGSEPDAMNELTGAFVRVEILEGEPVTDRKLLKTDDTGFMAAVLAPGMRAVAAEISVETAAGGFILPNDRVDVILTHNVEVRSGDFITEKPVSETVLNNVRVLAIDQTFGSGWRWRDHFAVDSNTGAETKKTLSHSRLPRRWARSLWPCAVLRTFTKRLA